MDPSLFYRRIAYVYIGRVPASFNNSARDPKVMRLTFFSVRSVWVNAPAKPATRRHSRLRDRVLSVGAERHVHTYRELGCCPSSLVL